LREAIEGILKSMFTVILQEEIEIAVNENGTCYDLSFADVSQTCEYSSAYRWVLSDEAEKYLIGNNRAYYGDEITSM
jgi:hypothetical protein